MFPFPPRCILFSLSVCIRNLSRIYFLRFLSARRFHLGRGLRIKYSTKFQNTTQRTYNFVTANAPCVIYNDPTTTYLMTLTLLTSQAPTRTQYDFTYKTSAIFFFFLQFNALKDKKYKDLTQRPSLNANVVGLRVRATQSYAHTRYRRGYQRDVVGPDTRVSPGLFVQGFVLIMYRGHGIRAHV